MKKIFFPATARSKTIVTDYMVEIYAATPKQCIEFENKVFFSQLCESGCKNFNNKWSCPPNAPAFSTISLSWRELYIIYMRMPMCAFAGIKNEYLRIKAANSMLKSRADKYVRKLAEKYGKSISTGSCRLCKFCKIKEGKPCAYPSVMAYSFEALGINVGALINKFSDYPLLWYRKGNSPDYTSVVCGLLTNEEIDLEELKKQYFNIIREA